MSLSPEARREVETLIAQRAEQPIADIRSRLTTEQDPEILAGRLRRLTDRVNFISGSGGGGGTGGTPDPLDPGEPFTPGDASTPGAAVSYEERTRGGAATLVGFSEFTSPSTPAEKYRVKTLSGSVSTRIYDDAGATVPSVQSRLVTVTNESVWTGTGHSVSIVINGVAVDSWGFPPLGSPRSYSVGGGTITWGISGSQTLTEGGPAGVEQVLNGWTGPGTYVRFTALLTAGGGSITETLTYSGTSSFDVTTGTQTNAGAMSGGLYSAGVVSPTSATGLATVDGAETILGASTLASEVLTRTTRSRPAGTAIIGVSGKYRKVTTSSLLETLSAEDTDSHAIARLLAGAGGTWGSWGAAASFPAATADYDARTTGFTFDYYQSQLRANYTGMPPDWTFKARVRIAKVNQTTGAISTVSTLVFTPTTDGSGDASWTVDVQPTEPDHTWRVQSVSHSL